MSSVYKDGKGGWVYQVKIGYYDNGKTKYKRFRAKTKREVIEKAEKYVALSGDSDISIKDYIEYYIDTYKRNVLKPTSLSRDYCILTNQIAPNIGWYKLKQLTPMNIQTQLINKLVDEGYSFSTIHKSYNLLNESLKKAIAEERLLKNPCESVNLPAKNKIETKKIEILNDDEVKLLLDVAYSRRFDNGFQIALVLFTGLRVGELCALEWSDINLEERYINVHKTVISTTQYNKDGSKERVLKIQEGTKNNLSRKVPINDKALEILELIKETNPNSNRIINTTSKIPDISVVSAIYNRMLKYAGIKGRTGIHTLRHTFASYFLKKGVSINIVSDILGHSSTFFTYDVYVHILEEQKKAALDLLQYDIPDDNNTKE